MRWLSVVALAVALLAHVALADIYLHMPRGSNDRLNEANNDRNNANRLFDSQNNDRGGYNVGDVQATQQSDGEGIMQYIAGSILQVEWTNQHGCGVGHNNLHCDLVLQYMCEDTGGDADGQLASGPAALGWRKDQTTPMRDGTTTNTIGQNAPNDMSRGRQEPQGWFTDCDERERNKGLFLADQNLNGDTARYTRQDNNGGNNQYGYECPEERDYWPYWHPTPWIDIAVLTSQPAHCPWYLANSNNVQEYGYCVGEPEFNTQQNCTNGGGAWTMYSHKQLPYTPAPMECLPADWSRDNHLGDGATGQNNHYQWTIPNIPARSTCVFRIRYNITTGDYVGSPAEGTFMDASNNGNKSPVRDNPLVDFGIKHGLQLAHNTDQIGRTFQDRSHIFSIIPRPAGVSASANIYNLGVRGKRGNIVQVYPAVEYDFTPNPLTVKSGDYVHIQWTGSNTNDNGNEGEGTAGTDKSNIVQIVDLNDNYPMPIDAVTMFTRADAVELASVGCVADTTCDATNGQLNNRPAYYDAGLFQFKSGTYNYMCTRNNNFSNRSQKGQIISS